MLDEEHARLLQQLAERYGVSMAAYLRGLVRAAWEAEERGVNAVAALRRGVLFEYLVKLSALPMPAELFSFVNEEAARAAGRRVGAGLAAVAGGELGDFLAGLAERLGVGVAEYRRLLLLPQYDRVRKVIVEFLRGIAEGGGLRVVEEGDTVVVVWGEARVEG